MKSKICIYFVLLGLLAIPHALKAQLLPFQYTTNGENFFYDTNNGQAIIVGGQGVNSIIIPGTLGGLPVGPLGPMLYFSSPVITSVIITNGSIPIENWAFSRILTLTNVVIGSGITNIGINAFSHCTAMSQITVDPLNPAYSSVGGVLFDKNLNTLIRCVVNPGGSYIVPASVTNIGPSAFSECSQLTNIAIPGSVINIGSNAFDSCTSLAGIALPDSVTCIGSMTFAMCASLTNLALGAGLTSVGDYAFILCTNLASIVIPDSVTNIGNGAFEFCTGLTNITIGTGVTSIGDSAFWSCIGLLNVSIPGNGTIVENDAFWSCTSLTNIALGSGVTAIGTNAFYWCLNLDGISVDPLNPSFSGVHGVLFNRNQTVLVEYPDAVAGDYAIPGGVTSVGNFAFSDSGFVTTVTLPNSVTGIGVSGFEDCTSLSGLYFQGNAPAADVTAFNYDTNIFVFYLPGGTGWGTTFDGLPAAPWAFQVPSGPGSLGVLANQFGFNLTGSTNLAVVIEGCTNLSSQGWVPIQTNLLTGGSFYFGDPQWTNYPSRFYRIHSP